jgi:hypothetical protein
MNAQKQKTMKMTKLLLPLITFIVIITSCGKDDLPTVDGGLTAKPSMLATKPDEVVIPSDNATTNGSDKTKLAVPVVTAAITGTSVVVAWDAIPNAVGYHVVFGDVDSTANSIPSQKPGLVTSVTVSDLPGGNFKVKVKALAANGNNSMFIDGPFSGVTTFTVISIPPVVPPIVLPPIVTVTKLATPIVTASPISYNSGNGSTSVSWGPVINATGYSVTVNGVPVSDNISPYSLSNKTPGTYVVGVKASSSNANYSISNEGTVSITIKPRNPISTPVISGNVTYTTPSAGTVSVTPLFIWPPNNKLTTVTFVGSGLSTGTGSITASHNTDTHATEYEASPLTQSSLAPGSYTLTVKAIAGGTYYDENWVNSAVGSRNFTVAPGSLKGKLVDEYGVYTKEYMLTSSFTLPLQLMASRLGTDKTGRDYTFTITATNGGGTTATGVSAVSNVPHDQR